MKPIYKLISIILICSLLASCSTTQKIQVSGLAGTEIYTPGLTKVGTISGTGTAEIILDSDAYYAYLLSKNNGSDQYIPFALDYEEKNYTWAKIAKGVGYPFMIAGGIACLSGLIVSSINSDNTNSAIVGLCGLGIGLGGLFGVAGGSSVLNSIEGQCRFKYLKTQSTNQDFFFEKPQFITVDELPSTEEKKESETKKEEESIVATKATTQTSKTTKKVVAPAQSEATSKSTKKLTSKSTKSLKDYGLAVEGIYVGSGSLSLGTEVIETYDDIVVKIVRVDNNSVEVSVVESNGSDFFSEASIYTIKKGSNNTYTLTHNDIAKATIKIDKNKKAIYIHPRVDIDGDIYTLKITATLKK